jgi:hypothetical protein
MRILTIGLIDANGHSYKPRVVRVGLSIFSSVIPVSLKSLIILRSSYIELTEKKISSLEYDIKFKKKTMISLVEIFDNIFPIT